jgi:hypothetical protein
MAEFFGYAVDPRLALFWLPFGVRPSKDGVTITDDGTFRATYGTPSVPRRSPLDGGVGQFPARKSSPRLMVATIKGRDLMVDLRGDLRSHDNLSN